MARVLGNRGHGVEFSIMPFCSEMHMKTQSHALLPLDGWLRAHLHGDGVEFGIDEKQRACAHFRVQA